MNGNESLRPLASLKQDLQANRGRPRELLILLLLRLAQEARMRNRFVGAVATISYRLLSEVVFNVELRPETKVGPGLKIFHSTGLVVETGTVLGANVKLHHNVTIGVAKTGGLAPVIEDGVEVGVGALILGAVRIGEGARIGAGALVLDDVPAGGIARAQRATIRPPKE